MQHRPVQRTTLNAAVALHEPGRLVDWSIWLAVSDKSFDIVQQLGLRVCPQCVREPGAVRSKGCARVCQKARRDVIWLAFMDITSYAQDCGKRI